MIENWENSSERQRVIDGFRQLQAEIGAPPDSGGHKTAEQVRADAEARLAELAASAPENAIMLSPELRAKMGAGA